MKYRMILLAAALFASANEPAHGTDPLLPDPELRRLFGLPEGDIPEPAPVLPVGERLASVAAAHMGGNRLLFALVFRDPLHINAFDGAHLQVYLDLDHDPATGRSGAHPGVDVQILFDAWGLIGQGHREVPNVSIPNPAYRDKTTVRANIQGRLLFLLVDAPLANAQDGEILLRMYLDMRHPDGHEERSPRDQVLRLARHEGHPEAIPERATFSSLRPSDYRALDPVPLEALHHRGITRAAVVPVESVRVGRDRPGLIADAAGRSPTRLGQDTLHTLDVSVLEEAGIDREGVWISFGVPLPRGALFDAGRMAVTDASGRRLAAQRTVAAYWPDDSLKWVRMHMTDDLAALAENRYTVHFDVATAQYPPREAHPQALVLREEGDLLQVDTGPLRAEIDRIRFTLVSRAWHRVDGDHGAYRPIAIWDEDGVRVVDAHGTRFRTSARPPDRFAIEEAGPVRAVVRVEGAYGADDGTTFMRYVTRLTFTAGSSVVAVEHSHINDQLDTEFSDFRSVTMALHPAGGIESAAAGSFNDEGDYTRLHGRDLALFQASERQFEAQTGAVRQSGTRLDGTLRIEGGHGALGLAVEDFWQRWPKGFQVQAGSVRVDLLPAQPDPSFGSEEPFYLRFPFLSGLYRLKWGMSFTERLRIDFGGNRDLSQLAAEIEAAPIAVLPGEWTARTEALGIFPVQRGRDFAAWDAYFEEAFERHRERQRYQREYGFLNYGDYQGERDRNWANNEYDTAHAFFLQFARTGNRAYYRAALTAARHQADVDMIHAHPDPAFIGANKCHSVGHTGNPHSPRGGWSFNAAWRFSAANGHTWAEGLTKAWHLAGDARCMETAVMLGEHIVWAVAPNHTGGDRSTGWMLRALMAIYRSTADPLYLETARELARELIRVKEGSVVRVPEPGIVLRPAGQNTWMFGVYLGALKQVYRETGDPELGAALDRGVRFLADAWRGGGWPARILGSTLEGAPISDGSGGMLGDLLRTEALAFRAAETGDPRLLRIAHEAALGQVYLENKLQARGQRLVMALRSGGAALGWLQRALDRQDAGRSDVLTGDEAELTAYLEAFPVVPAQEAGQGLQRVAFHVPAGCDAFSVEAEARYTGAYGLAVLDPQGRVAAMLRTENPWGPAAPPAPDAAVLRVRTNPGDRDATWSAIAWSRNMHHAIRFSGAPAPFFPVPERSLATEPQTPPGMPSAEP